MLEKVKTWVASLPILDLERVEGGEKKNQMSIVLTKTATEKYLIPDGLGFSVIDHVWESIHLKSILTG